MFGAVTRTYRGEVIKVVESAWSEGAGCFGGRSNGHLRVYRSYHIRLENGAELTKGRWEELPRGRRLRTPVLVDPRTTYFLGISSYPEYANFRNAD